MVEFLFYICDNFLHRRKDIESVVHHVKRMARRHSDCWLEVTEPSATNLACICKINLWGVVWRGGLLDLASESHRVIRVGT